jgi:hypothetical protein
LETRGQQLQIGYDGKPALGSYILYVNRQIIR